MYSPRVDRDAFFTRPESAEECVKLIFDAIPDALERPWVEPSAGAGAFVDAAVKAGVKRVEAYDIHPLHPAVQEANFLARMEPFEPGTIVFGNPPYGKSNALAVAFVNHAFYLGAEYVCFLLMGSMSVYSNLRKLKGGLFSYTRRREDFIDIEGNLTLRNFRNIGFIMYKAGVTASVSHKFFSRCSFQDSAKADYVISRQGIHREELSFYRGFNGVENEVSGTISATGRGKTTFQLLYGALELEKEVSHFLETFKHKVIVGLPTPNDLNLHFSKLAEEDPSLLQYVLK